MQSSIRLIVSTFLLTSAFAAYHSSAKLRRDNLYPFPRVGRASHHTWQVPINDLYLDYEPVDKRQLYAFPRVGRGGLTEDHAPARRSDSPGMWFGPRLGRAFKSDEDDITNQNDSGRSEPELMEAVHDEREKRQINQN